jgi:hypothetical protein
LSENIFIRSSLGSSHAFRIRNTPRAQAAILNSNGGTDNITVVLTRIKKPGKRSKNYPLPQLGREPAMSVPDLEHDPQHPIIFEPTRPVSSLFDSDCDRLVRARVLAAVTYQALKFLISIPPRVLLEVFCRSSLIALNA